MEFIEVGPRPELTVFTFRFICKNKDPSSLNQQILEQMHKDGRIFISSTKIENEVWLRVAILSFRTHLKEIELLIEMVEKHFKNQFKSSIA